MKQILKSIALLAFVAGLVSCNNVAKYETYAFVSFGGTKYNVREDAGVFKIPVNLVSDKNLTTTVTYRISSKSTAVKGTDYTIPNETNDLGVGVLTISTDPATKCDSIEICPIAALGTITNNKSLILELETVVGEDIYLGATDSCKVTLVDIDGPLFRMIGDWSGTVTGYRGDIKINWSIEECEEGEAAAYPNANLKISTGSIMDLSYGLKTEKDVYCYFDQNLSELQIYPAQLWLMDMPFDIGDLSFSIDEEATMNGTPVPVTLSYNDNTLTFDNLVYYALWTRDSEGNADLCAGPYDLIKPGGILRKND